MSGEILIFCLSLVLSRKDLKYENREVDSQILKQCGLEFPLAYYVYLLSIWTEFRTSPNALVVFDRSSNWSKKDEPLIKFQRT